MTEQFQLAPQLAAAFAQARAQQQARKAPSQAAGVGGAGAQGGLGAYRRVLDMRRRSERVRRGSNPGECVS